jgi:hypothetical protein
MRTLKLHFADDALPTLTDNSILLDVPWIL